MTDLEKKLRYICSEDEINRVCYNQEEDTYYIDVHYMFPAHTRRFLRNLEALNLKKSDFVIIHGYIHGTVLRDMIWEESFFRKEHELEIDSDNLGRTRVRFL